MIIQRLLKSPISLLHPKNFCWKALLNAGTEIMGWCSRNLRLKFNFWWQSRLQYRLLTVKYQNYHGMFFTLCSLEAIYFHFEDKKKLPKVYSSYFGIIMNFDIHQHEQGRNETLASNSYVAIISSFLISLYLIFFIYVCDYSSSILLKN